LPPYYALGIFTGSQTDIAWNNVANITEKIDRYVTMFPIEGVLLDQFTSSDNLCPFEYGLNFIIKPLYDHLKSKNLKLYLSIRGGIPTNKNCTGFKLAKNIVGCLLTKANNSTDYTVGIGQKVNSTGNKSSDFYEMAFIDVFNGETADVCMNYLMINLLGLPSSQMITYDGLYLRDNEPFTISNGTDLNISHYIMKSDEESATKGMFGKTFNPEAIGQYEGYHISND